jgi:hypothetical protein
MAEQMILVCDVCPGASVKEREYQVWKSDIRKGLV